MWACERMPSDSPPSDDYLDLYKTTREDDEEVARSVRFDSGIQRFLLNREDSAPISLPELQKESETPQTPTPQTPTPTPTPTFPGQESQNASTPEY